MKLLLITDAWHPQVNGVVTTLVELVHYMQKSGHEVEVIQPSLFATRPCPGYPGIDLANKHQTLQKSATLDSSESSTMDTYSHRGTTWLGCSQILS